MAEIEQVRVPDVGDVDNVTVAEVLVAPGDEVAVDDSLIALESDKASMEVPSPIAGTIRVIMVAVDDEVSHGDVILGLASSGCHSNGYSLVRKLVEEGVRAGRLDLRGENDELNTTLGGALLAPTRIYVKTVLNLRRDFTLKGIVHITGGGFPGNIPRILPKSVRARIDPDSWPRPPLFGLLQRQAEIPEGEMLRVFNCGIGMILIVSREHAEDIQHRLQGMGERAYRIGLVERKTDDEPLLHYAPLPDGSA